MAKVKKANLAIEDALIPLEEHPYDIPKNWCWVRWGNVIQLISGRDAKLADCNDSGIGIPYILGASNIDNNTFSIERWIEKPQVVSQKGDILLSVKGTIGKIYEQQEEEINISRQIMALRATGKLDSKYLYWFLHQVCEELKEAGNGLIPGIARDDILNKAFPLSPVAEQQRIVKQIEELFAKLDEAKDKVLDALDGFDSRKNAVLYKAFSGELSQTWRESNKVIKDTWSTVLLKELIVSGPQNGMYKEKSAYGDGTKILRIDGFYDGYIVAWDKLKRLTLNDEELECYRLKVNDIVINRVNSMPYLGKSALVRELPEECVYESNMMRIKIDEAKVYLEYLIKYLNSMMGLQELRKNAKQAVNQASINQQDVKNVKVILPSLDEQIEIVRLLELFTDEEVEAKERIESVIEQIDLMKKSILAKAFRGELGTNNSDEESAVELLKLILANNM